MNKPLISICMLCFNHEKYVAKSIESVLNQTYENWELIITDNASTDGSRTIIEEYAQKERRIKFHQLEHNSFPSGGLNNCIHHSKGDYITIISADDYFHERKLELQIEYMVANSSNICFTWCKVVDGEGGVIENHFVEKHFNKKITKKELVLQFMQGATFLHAVTPMIEKRYHEHIGHYDGRLLQTQDFELWTRIVGKEKIDILEIPLTYYRVHENNLSLSNPQNATCRGQNEYIFIAKNFLNNFKEISVILELKNDEELKYQILFDYFLENQQYPFAMGVMLESYKALGSDFEFPSSLYKQFLYMSSKLDVLKVRSEVGKSYNSKLWVICQKFLTLNSMVRARKNKNKL